MGKIITFYSYKGGVGRSLALANVAVVLAKWQYKILVVDWDLEAPGIEFFFSSIIDPVNVSKNRGIIDLLHEFSENSNSDMKELHWANLISSIPLRDAKEPIHLLTSGKRDNNYFKRVRSLDLEEFYKKMGGHFIENLRNEWIEEYDYVLIDSRTGFTDIGGVCTIQLPDVLVLFYTPAEQSINGIVEASKKARRLRKNLPFDRYTLKSLPIASRIDAKEEFLEYKSFIDTAASKVSSLMSNWLPEYESPLKFIEGSKLPYIAYFSFRERLAVIEQGTADAGGLGYAYESLAALIANDLAFVTKFMHDRESYVRIAKKSEIIKQLNQELFIDDLEKKNIFVDRNEHINQLLDLLNYLDRYSSSYSPYYLRIVSVWGIGGIGKTELLKQALKQYNNSEDKLIISVQLSAVKSYVRQTTISSIITMDFIKNANIDEKEFKETLLCRKSIARIDKQKIRQALNDIENVKLQKDIHKELLNLGLFGLNTLNPKSEILIKDNPIINIAADKLIESFKDKTSVSSPFLTYLGLRKKDSRLQDFPEQELATSLYQDIKNIINRRKKKAFLLIIDDFEALYLLLENFLVTYLLDLLKSAPFKSLVILIGRDNIDWTNKWSELIPHKEKSIRLDVLHESDAKILLKKAFNIKDENTIETIVKKSECHPLLLQTIGESTIEDPQAGDMITAVYKFFKRITYQMTKEQTKWLEALSFLDIRVDLNTIAVMLPSENPEKILNWFKGEASVRASSKEGWIVEEIIRKFVRLKVRTDSYKQYQKFIERAEKAHISYNKNSKFPT